MGKTLKSVAHYLGHQAIDPIKLSANPLSSKNWRTIAADATNTDPGNIVRNNAGNKAADTLHNVVDSVAPAIVGTLLSPAAGAGLSAAINYGNGGSLGSSLGKGAISLGASYAGNAIGGLAAGGGGSSFNPSSLFGSGSSGSFGGGAKDLGNLFSSTPNVANGLSTGIPSSTPTSFNDISDADINKIGSNFGSNAASNTASNLNTLAPSAGTTGGTTLAGNIGLGRGLASVAGGVGQGLAINQAAADQLKAIRGQQENLNSFDPSGITNDPGYQFQYDQGLQGLQRQLAAQGGTQSGAALKAAQQYGQNYANNAFDDYYNRWASKTGAQNQLLAGKGNVQSNALLGQGQNLSQTLNNVFNPSQGVSLADILKQIAVR